ncbi:phage virion morphogenesis protein [Riemerella columbipharyngis]|uniref:Phage virion morphogenesis family protein n=1 Tax=Riemerella columbipharyngis TaxID=1071918 RepID=A0A1G7DQX4_9FLAO|nr:phage virion morphogenesis protein [Riemerella columbipharyngis]SDE53893.1 Phage virion morphogenesis family protein [Riemerella columbipharyngis]
MEENQVPDFMKMAEEMLQGLPQRVAEQARNHFMKSFIKEGFTANSFIAWPKRKDTLPHKMLSLSYTLKNSIKISRADFEQVIISAGEGIPYAAIHNEGGNITIPVTPKMRKYFWAMHKKTGEEFYKNMALTKKDFLSVHIPKRQYIGNSAALGRKIRSIIIRQIKQAGKQLNWISQDLL